VFEDACSVRIKYNYHFLTIFDLFSKAKIIVRTKHPEQFFLSTQFVGTNRRAIYC
jgi:hypothetical protein